MTIDYESPERDKTHAPPAVEPPAAAPAASTRPPSRAQLRRLGGYAAQTDALRPGRGGGYAAQVQALAPTLGPHQAVHRAAAEGIRGGGGGALPHLGAIQRAFGRHDVSRVQAFVGSQATRACEDMGAEGYAADGKAAFKGAPDLFTSAHEAAHIVQQRGGVQLRGGVGEVGDPYERHANAVADKVVRGESAEGLLDRYAGGASGGRVEHGAVQQKGGNGSKDSGNGKGHEENKKPSLFDKAVTKITGELASLGVSLLQPVLQKLVPGIELKSSDISAHDGILSIKRLFIPSYQKTRLPTVDLGRGQRDIDIQGLTLENLEVTGDLLNLGLELAKLGLAAKSLDSVTDMMSTEGKESALAKARKKVGNFDQTRAQLKVGKLNIDHIHVVEYGPLGGIKRALNLSIGAAGVAVDATIRNDLFSLVLGLLSGDQLPPVPDLVAILSTTLQGKIHADAISVGIDQSIIATPDGGMEPKGQVDLTTLDVVGTGNSLNLDIAKVGAQGGVTLDKGGQLTTVGVDNAQLQGLHVDAGVNGAKKPTWDDIEAHVNLVKGHADKVAVQTPELGLTSQGIDLATTATHLKHGHSKTATHGLEVQSTDVKRDAKKDIQVPTQNATTGTTALQVGVNGFGVHGADVVTPSPGSKQVAFHGLSACPGQVDVDLDKKRSPLDPKKSKKDSHLHVNVKDPYVGPGAQLDLTHLDQNNPTLSQVSVPNLHVDRVGVDKDAKKDFAVVSEVSVHLDQNQTGSAHVKVDKLPVLGGTTLDVPVAKGIVNLDQLKTDSNLIHYGSAIVTVEQGPHLHLWVPGWNGWMYVPTVGYVAKDYGPEKLGITAEQQSSKPVLIPKKTQLGGKYGSIDLMVYLEHILQGLITKALSDGASLAPPKPQHGNDAPPPPAPTTAMTQHDQTSVKLGKLSVGATEVEGQFDPLVKAKKIGVKEGIAAISSISQKGIGIDNITVNHQSTTSLGSLPKPKAPPSPDLPELKAPEDVLCMYSDSWKEPKKPTKLEGALLTSAKKAAEMGTVVNGSTILINNLPYVLQWHEGMDDRYDFTVTPAK